MAKTMVKKAALCCELGGNYGHLASFLPLCGALESLGIAVELILQPRTTQALLAGYSLKCHQAPLLNPSPVTETYTYADVLAQAGYDNALAVTEHIQRWRELLVAMGADVIVANHAPGALLAARSLGLPASVFGSGFLVPPLQDPLPVFHLYQNTAPADAYRHHAPVLKAMNTALQQFGAAPLTAIADLFDVDERFLCTLPELDHHPMRQGEDYWGPYFADSVGQLPSWPEVAGPKIFAYLTPSISALPRLLADLAGLPGSKLVHIPKASPQLIAEYENPGLKISPEPINMRELLVDAELVIHQGGIGTTAACLFAGVRQLLVPTQLEQMLTCKTLVTSGLAYGALDADANYREQILQALACPVLKKSVRAFQQKYEGFDQREQYAAIAEAIVDLVE